MLQNYVRNLVNFDISVVGHLDNFDKMQAYLDQGDNVVCLANHQTEADPGDAPRAFTFFDYAMTAPKGEVRVYGSVAKEPRLICGCLRTVAGMTNSELVLHVIYMVLGLLDRYIHRQVR